MKKRVPERMLQLDTADLHVERDVRRERSVGEILAAARAAARRQSRTIGVTMAVAFAAGLAYLLVTPATWTAVATMVIDSRKVQVLRQESVVGDITVDAATIQTQVEVLNSENISQAVVDELHLVDDPEFGAPGWAGRIVETITTIFGAPSAGSAFERSRTALKRFEQARSVRRIGLTYAIEIRFTSRDPDKAARIANAIANAYLVDQLEARYETARRASAWLQDRIGKLRAEAFAADRDVIEYKKQNRLVNAGGRLMNEQQLGELNSQLVAARSATAEAKARLDRLNEILKEKVPTESVTDALKNEVIVKLREQYVDLAAREANWSGKYGADHLAAVNLRNQMQEIRHHMAQELQRIRQAYQSDYDIARARAESIEGILASAVAETQSANHAQVELRELESNAQTYRTIHDAFLQRYAEAVQQQSFPMVEARVISRASRPLEKSHPKALVVLYVAAVAGALVSFGIAYVRETGIDVFRTAAEVEQILQVSCLAVLPMLQAQPQPGRRGRNGGPGGAAAPSSETSVLSHAVAEPFSHFAEAIRSIKVAADLRGLVHDTKIVGVTSTDPGEGKSTVAANLARLIAHAGYKAVLIDADLRSRALTRALAPDATRGLRDVVAAGASAEDAIVTDPPTGVRFLPAGDTGDLVHSNEILASPAMKALLDDLRAKNDFIVLDFPPLATVADVRATGGVVDAYLYVIAWGRTRSDAVRRALGGAPALYERLLGVVLNKADPTPFGRVEPYRDGPYYPPGRPIEAARRA